MDIIAGLIGVAFASTINARGTGSPFLVAIAREFAVLASVLGIIINEHLSKRKVRHTKVRHSMSFNAI